MAKYHVQFKDHPLVKGIDAKNKEEAIEKAKVVRGLDGIGHEDNNLLVSAETVAESKKDA